MSGAGQNAVRVTVDPELCMGSGTCMAVAPDLFDMGGDGTAIPLQSPVERNAKLDQAVSRCPTGAIAATRPE
jgi:ferredoxin